ncbi:hypothetical protein JKP88DRAFT_315022 [Tribonema minus]|uniref:Uncharacterized protein n=1 Tax=Tribonema minus TaxID=303371 RepID=A0A835Z3K8_9STRA|nr:hypothetical protein JKP88DRAFT_315022 [Tribonema minus]
MSKAEAAHADASQLDVFLQGTTLALSGSMEPKLMDKARAASAAAAQLPHALFQGGTNTAGKYAASAIYACVRALVAGAARAVLQRRSNLEREAAAAAERAKGSGGSGGGGGGSGGAAPGALKAGMRTVPPGRRVLLLGAAEEMGRVRRRRAADRGSAAPCTAGVRRAWDKKEREAGGAAAALWSMDPALAHRERTSLDLVVHAADAALPQPADGVEEAEHRYCSRITYQHRYCSRFTYQLHSLKLPKGLSHITAVATARTAAPPLALAPPAATLLAVGTATGQVAVWLVRSGGAAQQQQPQQQQQQRQQQQAQQQQPVLLRVLSQPFHVLRSGGAVQPPPPQQQQQQHPVLLRVLSQVPKADQSPIAALSLGDGPAAALAAVDASGVARLYALDAPHTLAAAAAAAAKGGGGSGGGRAPEPLLLLAVPPDTLRRPLLDARLEAWAAAPRRRRRRRRWQTRRGRGCGRSLASQQRAVPPTSTAGRTANVIAPVAASSASLTSSAHSGGGGGSGGSSGGDAGRSTRRRTRGTCVALHPARTAAGARLSMVVGTEGGSAVMLNADAFDRNIALCGDVVYGRCFATYEPSLPSVVDVDVLHAGSAARDGGNACKRMFSEHHRAPVILIDFCGGGDGLTMVTLDAAHVVAVWEYSADSATGYAWNAPTRAAALDLGHRTYAPDQATVIVNLTLQLGHRALADQAMGALSLRSAAVDEVIYARRARRRRDDGGGDAAPRRDPTSTRNALAAALDMVHGPDFRLWQRLPREDGGRLELLVPTADGDGGGDDSGGGGGGGRWLCAATYSAGGALASVVMKSCQARHLLKMAHLLRAGVLVEARLTPSRLELALLIAHVGRERAPAAAREEAAALRGMTAAAAIVAAAAGAGAAAGGGGGAAAALRIALVDLATLAALPCGALHELPVQQVCSGALPPPLPLSARAAAAARAFQRPAACAAAAAPICVPLLPSARLVRAAPASLVRAAKAGVLPTFALSPVHDAPGTDFAYLLVDSAIYAYSMETGRRMPCAGLEVPAAEAAAGPAAAAAAPRIRVSACGRHVFVAPAGMDRVHAFQLGGDALRPPPSDEDARRRRAARALRTVRRHATPVRARAFCGAAAAAAADGALGFAYGPGGACDHGALAAALVREVVDAALSDAATR